MPTILIIDRNSIVKPYNVKIFAEEELFKKAGFKNKEGFAKHTEWAFTVNGERCVIELYGKTTGRAGQENKYEFPPPVDKVLFFGSCVLVCKENGKVSDISPKEWEKVYEYLHGGFDDITAAESSDTEDDDDSEGVPRTKQGYVKDGFIVDDDEADGDYTGSSSDEETTRRTKTKKATKPTPKKNTRSVGGKKGSKLPTTTSVSTEQVMISQMPSSVATENIQITIEEPTYLSCTDELDEEPYI